MFENSSSTQRYRRSSGPQLRVHLGYAPQLDHDPAEERKTLRLAVVLGLLVHVGLFWLHLPPTGAEPIRIGTPKKVFVLQETRFAPPPPAPQRQIPVQREKRRIIPVPDPTPDEPEPIRVAEIEVPDPVFEDVVGDFGIPDAPPGTGRGGVDAIPVSGNVTPPVKIHAPSPQYTEEARQARVQGVVILEATIDREGRVVDVQVLKGLPMGLTDSAVQTARQWLFRPATQNGQPVAVFFNLMVSFSLQ